MVRKGGGGAQRWCAKVARKGGAQRWCAKVAVVRKGGAQRWRASVAVSADRLGAELVTAELIATK